MVPRRGLTLVELLAVIAILSLLITVLVPAVGTVRRSVAKSATRSQFTQYLMAYEAFRAETGFYPSMGVHGAEFALEGHNDVFVETLSGRDRAGGPSRHLYAVQANPRRILFHHFGENEFAREGSPHAGQLVDGLGNPHLHVVIDRDLDGIVEPSDFEALPHAERPAGPLRGGVFFYSANPAGNPDWDVLKSWE